MKKIVIVVVICFIMSLSSVSAFGYIQVKGLIYSDHSQEIITNEYIYRNGTAMIKLRDMLVALNPQNYYDDDGARFEYDKETKRVKVYLKNSTENQFLTYSISVKAGSNTINFTYNDFPGGNSFEQGCIQAKVTPTIINGSLYVSAIDLSKVLRGYNIAYIKNGVLHIPYGMHYI